MTKQPIHTHTWTIGLEPIIAVGATYMPGDKAFLYRQCTGNWEAEGKEPQPCPEKIYIDMGDTQIMREKLEQYVNL